MTEYACGGLLPPDYGAEPVLRLAPDECVIVRRDGMYCCNRRHRHGRDGLELIGRMNQRLAEGRSWPWETVSDE